MSYLPRPGSRSASAPRRMSPEGGILVVPGLRLPIWITGGFGSLAWSHPAVFATEPSSRLTDKSISTGVTVIVIAVGSAERGGSNRSRGAEGAANDAHGKIAGPERIAVIGALPPPIGLALLIADVRAIVAALQPCLATLCCAIAGVTRTAATAAAVATIPIRFIAFSCGCVQVNGAPWRTFLRRRVTGRRKVRPAGNRSGWRCLFAEG